MITQNQTLAQRGLTINCQDKQVSNWQHTPWIVHSASILPTLPLSCIFLCLVSSIAWLVFMVRLSCLTHRANDLMLSILCSSVTCWIRCHNFGSRYLTGFCIDLTRPCSSGCCVVVMHSYTYTSNLWGVILPACTGKKGCDHMVLKVLSQLT